MKQKIVTAYLILCVLQVYAQIQTIDPPSKLRDREILHHESEATATVYSNTARLYGMLFLP